MNYEPLCKNQSVVVVGTGPNFDPLYTPKGEHVYIAANGGAALCTAELGIEARILCTTSHLFRDDVDGPEFETRRSLISRGFSSIWVDTKNLDMDTAVRAIRRHNISYFTAYDCSPDVRSEIVKGACRFDAWVSTGVFAVCLAIYSGALVVRTNGISLQDGHVQDTEPRMHVREDRQCLNALVDIFPGLILQESLMGLL